MRCFLCDTKTEHFLLLFELNCLEMVERFFLPTHACTPKVIN